MLPLDNIPLTEPPMVTLFICFNVMHSQYKNTDQICGPHFFNIYFIIFQHNFIDNDVRQCLILKGNGSTSVLRLKSVMQPIIVEYSR